MKERFKSIILKELSKKKYGNTTARRIIYKWLNNNLSMTRKKDAEDAMYNKLVEYIKDGSMFEVYQLAVRRIGSFKKCMEDVMFLERHAYAPEMNKLHTNKKVFSVPQQKTIKDAVMYLVYTEIK
jgi:Lhr-like helicase